MRGTHPDRVWLVGGALSAVLLVMIGWFVVIGPQKAHTNTLNELIRTKQAQLPALQHRLHELAQENRELPRYRAELERNRQALPGTSALADLLRELQVAGENAGASVSGLVVGSFAQVPAGNVQIFALPVTLTAAGSPVALERFLDQLQRVQPRAVLISTANLTTSAGGAAAAYTLTLTLQIFVAPPAGAGKPSPAAG
jgi:Tfp pilus assembly protein PilN